MIVRSKQNVSERLKDWVQELTQKKPFLLEKGKRAKIY